MLLTVFSVGPSRWNTMQWMLVANITIMHRSLKSFMPFSNDIFVSVSNIIIAWHKNPNQGFNYIRRKLYPPVQEPVSTWMRTHESMLTMVWLNATPISKLQVRSWHWKKEKSRDSWNHIWAFMPSWLGHVGEAARTPTIGKSSGAGGAGGQGQAGHKPWQSARGPAPTRSTWRRFSSTRASLLLSV